MIFVKGIFTDACAFSWNLEFRISASGWIAVYNVCDIMLV